MFYEPLEKQNFVRWAMKDLMYISFEFEDGGTRVIHYTHKTYETQISQRQIAYIFLSDKEDSKSMK